VGFDAAMAVVRQNSAVAAKLDEIDPLGPGNCVSGVPHLQHDMSEARAKVEADAIATELRASHPDRPGLGRRRAADFLSGTGEGSAWTGIIPTQWGKALRLSDEQFRTALLLRLGVPLLRDESPCALCEGGINDVYGHHAFCCKGLQQRTQQHDIVKKVLAGLARKMNNAAVHVEARTDRFAQRNLATAVGIAEQANAHRTDIVIEPLNGEGGVRHIDVTVRQPTAAGGGDTAAGAAARAGYKQKVTTYQQRYMLSTDNIIPFAVETLGFLHDIGAVLLLKGIVKDSETKSGYAYCVRRAYQSIGVAIMRGSTHAVRVWRERCLPKEVDAAAG